MRKLQVALAVLSALGMAAAAGAQADAERAAQCSTYARNQAETAAADAQSGERRMHGTVAS